ncbi:glycosyltransferase family 2 protein [Polymorphobacter fuscus]|uniref:Glycosyltransferase n=1 Tax=Sandarakinorhabdus fusca TaxID=1439888 RepID=A0A7C9GQV9_9SPHN|nr:glycosyltransferase family 2 protein [Polymorphobacter fuscus]KAB7645514.1 glycosyltransferase family 2 protein [Polymorphobacter fuscus]MQT17950.1 glycosyltransferase [Polymorphobacter fuscus]NJC08580.1 glycosyltransferase involved in cell wall biosynthesis [Polymorphobacter fuscus]
MTLPLLSIVVPVFNEEATIDLFVTTITPVLDAITADWEIVFVNDGSRDSTLSVIRVAHDREPRVRGIDFSRNYGKEIALSAGLDHARGRAVVPMDVDLQDPPELIAPMVEQWRAGYDVVLARRSDRSSDSALKRGTAQAFYSVIAKLSDTVIPADVGDFRLIDARVVEALRSYPERMRFMKGIFADVGFRTTSVSYVRPVRAAGETKFNGRKLFNLALEGIVSFSTVPLKIWTYVGLAAALLAIAMLGYIVITTLVNGRDVPGYASLISVILFFNGLLLMGLGVQGEYIARIFAEVKGRPLYLVRERIGCPPPEA